MNTHPRYKQFPVHICFQGIPHANGKEFKIFLFRDEKKLRGHAVKHFLNLTETGWKSGTSISRAIKYLEDLECPFMVYKTNRPCCDSCKMYSKCTAVISDIETAYCCELEESIQEACFLPRYACFSSKEWNCRAAWLIPNRSMIIKTAYTQTDDTYNTATCFNIAGMKLIDFIEVQLSQLRREAEDRPVYCTETNWHMGNAFSEKPVRKQKKSKQSAQPYRRGGASNFRKYFNEE